MSEKKYDELQKLYDNPKIGALVQEICEYYVTNDGFADDSSQDELEPHEIVEAVYLLFCLQCRECLVRIAVVKFCPTSGTLANSKIDHCFFSFRVPNGLWCPCTANLTKVFREQFVYAYYVVCPVDEVV